MRVCTLLCDSSTMTSRGATPLTCKLQNGLTTRSAVGVAKKCKLCGPACVAQFASWCSLRFPLLCLYGGASEKHSARPFPQLLFLFPCLLHRRLPMAHLTFGQLICQGGALSGPLLCGAECNFMVVGLLTLNAARACSDMRKNGVCL